jgi:hypothetical protein
MGGMWGRPMTLGKQQACAPDAPPGSGPRHLGTDVQRERRELAPRVQRTARNYTKDEGRPFAAGLQGQAANHLKLLESKALVVSVEEKAPRRCQVWTTKMSASEPRRTCRNVKDDIKTRGVSRAWEPRGRDLLTGRVVSGIHVA